jgi:Tol biopolymer transport system component
MSLRKLPLIVVLVACLFGISTPAATAATKPRHPPTRLLMGTTSGRLITSRPDGSNRRFLFRGIEPTWSPDGSLVAFRSTGGTHHDIEIWIATADGEVVRRITYNDRPDLAPFWSPNGRRIGFWRGLVKPTLWTVRVDGTHPIKLRQAHSPRQARWSPDGRWISYSTMVGDYSQTFRLRADGSDNGALHRITQGSYATWSPGGKRIAVIRFVKIDNDEYTEIWAARVDGSDKEMLGRMRGTFPTSMSWSPNGDRVAFIRRYDVWTMATNGSGNLKRVAHTRAKEETVDWGRVP